MGSTDHILICQDCTELNWSISVKICTNALNFQMEQLHILHSNESVKNVQKYANGFVKNIIYNYTYILYSFLTNNA